MYFSMFDIGAVMIALATSITLILLTARANRDLIRQNRSLRAQNKRQAEQCRNYHSPRPF
jgi:type II secretory pathway component PulJ